MYVMYVTYVMYVMYVMHVMYVMYVMHVGGMHLCIYESMYLCICSSMYLRIYASLCVFVCVTQRNVCNVCRYVLLLSSLLYNTIHTCMHAYTHDAFLQISNYVQAMAHLINPCCTMLYISLHFWNDTTHSFEKCGQIVDDEKSVRSLHVHVMLWSLVRLWRRSATRLQRIVKSDN